MSQSPFCRENFGSRSRHDVSQLGNHSLHFPPITPRGFFRISYLKTVQNESFQYEAGHGQVFLTPPLCLGGLVVLCES